MIDSMRKMSFPVRFSLLFGVRDKPFYKWLFRLSLPIVLQQAISVALYMIDVVMIGALGESELAAVGAANQLQFFLIICLFGICGGGGVFIAQFWGKRDIIQIHRIQGLCLMLSLGLSTLFLLVAQFFGEALLRFFSPDAQVVTLGMQYLSIASLGYVLQATTLAFSTTLKACNRVWPAMLTGSIGLIANVVLNYILIFGHFGFNALGVKGAAIATVIAAGLDMALLIFWIYGRKAQAAAGIKAMIRQSGAHLKAFFHLTLPVLGGECLWSFSIVCLSFLYSHMGTNVLAGMVMFNTMERLAFVIFIGIGNSAAVMIGNRIGEGNRHLAFRYAKRFMALAIGIGALVGCALLILKPHLLGMFNVSEDVRTSVGMILTIFSIALPIHVFNFMVIVGILRSGGDTRTAMSIDALGQWLFFVPLAYLGGLVFHLPIHLVYLAGLPCEFYKAIREIRRMRSRAWVHDVTTAA